MDNYLCVVKQWPLPHTRGQVRAFLGKIGYYWKFIKDINAIAKSLSDRLKEDGLRDNDAFPITQEIEDSFENLRKRLLTAPILAYPKFDSPHPFILDTDWSQENNAIGGELSQVQDGSSLMLQKSYNPVRPSIPP